MDKIFENKVAVITGASSGIGKATAVLFARKGAKVAVVDWKDGNETADIIKTAGGESIFIKCDVSNDADVQAMTKNVIEKFGGIDLAFNNAGIEGISAPTHECTMENWDKTLNINLKGVWLCMKYQIPQMRKQGKGAIVNCSSVAGLIGIPYIPAYAASKHGLIGLTKAAALENSRKNIRINAVCPGVILTPMIDRYTGGSKESLDQLTAAEPVGRAGKPEEIAEAVAWLCSEAASFVTGVALPVDGGWVAQ